MSKNNYKVVVICSNGDKKGRYSFVENYDDDWSLIAEDKFYDEFAIKPTKCELESREII